MLGTFERSGRRASKAYDDEGDVVVRAVSHPHASQQSVSESSGGQSTAVGESGRQARQADVDVLPSAFDEAVGVQHERVPGV